MLQNIQKVSIFNDCIAMLLVLKYMTRSIIAICAYCAGTAEDAKCVATQAPSMSSNALEIELDIKGKHRSQSAVFCSDSCSHSNAPFWPHIQHYDIGLQIPES